MNFNQFDEDVSEDAPDMGEPSGGLEDMGRGNTQSAPTEGGDSGNMSEEEEQDQLRQQRILSIL